MLVYRLAKSQFIRDLSGEGSRLYGGRWNQINTPALYTSQHRSLCMLEVLATTPFAYLNGFELAIIQVPESAPIKRFTVEDLPNDWDCYPHIANTAVWGDQWLTSEWLAFEVPSSLVKQEYNVIINPRHADFEQVKLIEHAPLQFNIRFKNILS